MRIGAEGRPVNCKWMVCAVVVWVVWGGGFVIGEEKKDPRMAAIVADIKQSQALTAGG